MRNLLRKLGLASALLLAFAIMSPVRATVIDVYASSAPNAYGSPSFSGWMANSQCFLQGSCSEGDRSTDPAAFQTQTTFVPGDAMVTSFNSWRGQADPGSIFGPAFASELGNRMHFSLYAMSDVLFTLGDIAFDISSPDSGSSGYGGSGALGYSGTLTGTTFNGTSRVGLYWGADGIAGNGDDVLYNSNEADGTLINELFYVGVGNALWSQVPSDGINEMAALAAVSDIFYDPSDLISSITGTYTLLGMEGSATVNLSVVPVPPALPLFFSGLVGVAAIRRHKQKKMA